MQAVAHYRLPAFCPSCGAVFPSVLAIGGGSGVFRGNVQTCPRCGAMAQISDATFQTVVGEVLATVQAPGITRPMLIAFSAAVRTAYQERKSPEVLAQEVETINPSFGPLVRKSATGGSNWMPILALIFWTIQSIVSISIKLDLNLKLDVNQLFDQWMNATPRAVIEPPEPPASESPSPERPEMEPRPDQPPP